MPVKYNKGHLTRAERAVASAETAVTLAKRRLGAARAMATRIKGALEGTTHVEGDTKVLVQIVKMDALAANELRMAGRIEKQEGDTLFVTFVNRRGPVLEFRKSDDGAWATGLVGTAAYRLEKINA
jgi:hypothetical protein